LDIDGHCVANYETFEFTEKLPGVHILPDVVLATACLLWPDAAFVKIGNTLPPLRGGHHWAGAATNSSQTKSPYRVLKLPVAKQIHETPPGPLPDCSM
jgi:hypothetical protein